MIYAIIGASAGVGRALASAFASAGHDLILVASDARDLRALASDLEIRHGARVAAIAADVNDGDAYLDEVAAAVRRLGALDGMLFPLGATADEVADHCHLVCEVTFAGTGLAWSFEFRHGDPVTELLRAGADHDAAWIVVGRHGHRGLVRLVLGSVTDRLLHHADRPVLVVPPAGP